MRFIHLADVHLGAAPDPGYAWGRQREEEIWQSFRRLIRRIQEEKTELLLIAGDLFHRQPLARELKEVDYLFSTIKDTQVVVIAGNHDYLEKGSIYEHFVWNENVIFMKDSKMKTVYLEKLKTYVYGCSYWEREITSNIYDSCRPLNEKGCHILLAHGGDQQHIPITKARLMMSGFDYIALGHIHKPQIFASGQMAYAGALEPLDRNDTGTHGYIEGVWERGRVSVRFVPFAQRSYIDCQLEVTSRDTMFSIEEKVKKAIQDQGEQNLYRFCLTGVRDPQLELYPAMLERLGNITEIRDETTADYDYEKLREIYKGTLIGEFLEENLPNAHEPIDQKVLYYGVRALLESRK